MISFKEIESTLFISGIFICRAVLAWRKTMTFGARKKIVLLEFKKDKQLL